MNGIQIPLHSSVGITMNLLHQTARLRKLFITFLGGELTCRENTLLLYMVLMIVETPVYLFTDGLLVCKTLLQPKELAI